MNLSDNAISNVQNIWLKKLRQLGKKDSAGQSFNL